LDDVPQLVIAQGDRLRADPILPRYSPDERKAPRLSDQPAALYLERGRGFFSRYDAVDAPGLIVVPAVRGSFATRRSAWVGAVLDGDEPTDRSNELAQ
jgi:hypothetical protein